jgi:NADPH-dependent 2,4-dienoyl-CoA reductase/sulfur reductase-like enzyme
VANQIYRKFAAAGQALNEGDIAVLDAADYHHYQVNIFYSHCALAYSSCARSLDGEHMFYKESVEALTSRRTLVGSGLKSKEELCRPMSSVIASHLAHIPENVKSFSPDASSVTTTSGRQVSYDTLVVAAGLRSNFDAIPGLSEGLADASSGVSSIYSYNTCDKVWNDIESLRSGRAIFTQPAGIVKCAGGTCQAGVFLRAALFRFCTAPQKIMWMAWDRYRQTGRGDTVKLDFMTGMPTMFSVKRYSEALERLRIERGVGGHFQHNLVSIDVGTRKATFKKPDGESVTREYDLLHVVPPMGPWEFVKSSPLADSAGWVDVDQATLQHKKYTNVWAIGDCSNLPTSKTAAAITAQAPVLTENLFSVMTTGKLSAATYDGYTSCPV